MILPLDQVAQVKRGTKTQHRQLVRPRDDGRCPTPAGSEQPVRGTGQATACRVRILHVTQQHLYEITDDQARLEGCQDRQDFAALWLKRHDRRLGPYVHKMWPENIEEHFDERHGHKLVWVLEFELVVYSQHRPAAEGRPVWLAPKSGYTSDPTRGILDAGEVLDIAGSPTLADLEHRRRWEHEREQELADRARRLTVDDRIAYCRRVARATGNVAALAELRNIQRLLALGRERAAIERRLQATELHLDRRAA